MRIVLIHWKIRLDGVEAFLHFWREQAIVEDRAGLIGEFLSTAVDRSATLPWITWDLADQPSRYRSFVNVGIWQDAEAFHDQVSKYFSTEKEDFEYEPRVRALLDPEHWRIGERPLPTRDSDGVY